MKAKKSLGQNFLKSEMALKKIIEAGEIKPNDIVLEIGPGKGALTEKILEKTSKVIAVEKDQELFEMLQKKFVKEIAEKKLILINEDILKFNVLRSYKIIANIPYNITGAILKKFLTEKNQPERLVLMVQHEVAKRIVAFNKKESLLSISVKAYGEPKMIMKVPARYFSPAPKVDSTIIAIKNISREFFGGNKINEKKFWEIVKAGFAHKRKMLTGNLKPLLGNHISQTLKQAKIKENIRAEDISLEQWRTIAVIEKNLPSA